MEESPFQKTYNYSLKLLAIRKRTVRQLYHKLAEKKFDREAIQEVLASLQERKFLDDEEFARSYVASQVAQHPYGKVRLAQVLKRKGLSGEIVEKAVSELDANYEFNAATELAQPKWEALRETDLRSRRKKVYDFLVRKGFRFDVCRDVARQMH